MSAKLVVKSTGGGSLHVTVKDDLVSDQVKVLVKGFTGTFEDNAGKTVTVLDGQIVSVS